jgi:ribosomal protein L7Ae-like RNA K-turn-binding protein
MKSNALAWICLCRKAGKIKMGFDAAAQSLGRDAALVVFACDASENTKRRMQQKALLYKVPVCTLPHTEDEIWRTTGKRAVLMTIIDKRLAAQLAALTNREEIDR